MRSSIRVWCEAKRLLLHEYWCETHARANNESADSDSSSLADGTFSRDLHASPDPDVRARLIKFARTVQCRAAAGAVALGLLSLRKSFGRFHAVPGLDLGVDRGQLLCMLGHSSAESNINMLTGMLPITSGDATIYDRFVTRYG